MERRTYVQMNKQNDDDYISSQHTLHAWSIKVFSMTQEVKFLVFKNIETQYVAGPAL